MTADELMQLPCHPLRNKQMYAPIDLKGKSTDVILKGYFEDRREEDEALEMSVAQLGVQTPVIIDEFNQIVDGKRRIRAAYKFDKGMKIPVHICLSVEAELILVNSIMHLRHLTKFQRLFTVFPYVRDMANALVDIAARAKVSNFKAGNSPTAQTLRSRDDEAQNIADSVVYYGDGKRVVRLFRLEDLAQLLSVSARYLNYVKGIYDAIDAAEDPESAAVIAYRCIFCDSTPIERIASAVGGAFSERNTADEANRPMSELLGKVEKALETLALRVSKDSILHDAAAMEELGKRFETFALKLPAELRDILSKKLRAAQQITK